jgi:hypothetical protein
MVTEYSIRSVDPLQPDSDISVRPASVLPRQIPWGYNRDRVTAVAVDPNQLFTYWELRDETLDAARKQFGPGGFEAILTLRIYDTSGRIFDGNNAHSYFDQDVHRTDRQWFCRVGKPSSSVHTEMGLRGRDGRFQRIVRSGRVDFPRSSPAPGGPEEWMRVVPHSGAIASRETPHSGGPPAASLAASAPGGAGLAGDSSSPQGELETSDHYEHSETTPLFEHASSESWEWSEREALRFETDSGWQLDENDPNVSYRMISQRWEEFGLSTFQWESGPVESSWQAGPFTYPTEVITPAVEHYEGPRQVYRSGEQVRVLHGPWHVVIRGINPHVERRVLGRWEVHRSWLSVATRPAEDLNSLPGRRFAPGASERLPIGASELRLRGASEVFFLGASERRLGGASESRFMGASLYVMRGASERRLVGQSELRLAGQSELRLAGQSERRLAGQSELRMLGASERRLGGASEQRGASERRLGGASEQRIAHEPVNGKSPYPASKKE